MGWLVDPRGERERRLELLRRLPDPNDVVPEAIREAERQVRGDRSGGTIDEQQLGKAFRAARTRSRRGRRD